MRKNKRLFFLLCVFAASFLLFGQDVLPPYLKREERMKSSGGLKEVNLQPDTIPVFPIRFPGSFKEVGINKVDSMGVLLPVLERLRQVRSAVSEDSVRILHIGDSHVRGHLYPQASGRKLVEAFGAVSYTDMGINGATILSFTHPDRIAAIAEMRPELLIVSFGTNESHGRGYRENQHYYQMDEFVHLLQKKLPDVPILLTTPPGSFESFRVRRRVRRYAVNPRTAIAVATIKRYARNNRLAVWDLYSLVGGSKRASLNWQAAGLLRPDHIHYTVEGYELQGNLLYEAIIKVYNDYVTHRY